MMKVIYDVAQLENSPASVVSIGNFDGVHVGHQSILNQLTELSKAHHMLSTLVIFEPQPQEFFFNQQAPARLTNLAEKLFYLGNYNLDQVIVLKFDEQFKSLSAQDFIDLILIKKLNTKHLIVGEDFKFGAGRKGNLELLQSIPDFLVSKAETVLFDNTRISSSRVRLALANQNFSLAQQLLNRPYSMRGEVVKGDQRGRQLGAPTANVKPDRAVLPMSGVFAVKVHGLARDYFGVANLGKRPTVTGEQVLLEAHLFDCNQDIYGEIINVEFIQKIRDEQRFASLDDLKHQIHQDISMAKLIQSLV